MDSKKLERIVIIILLLLNAALLTVVLRDQAQSAGSRRETAAALRELLSGAGITAGPEAELLQDCPPSCTVVRDLAMEEQRVTALLGRHNSEDLGGSIRFYNGESGQARMRGTGELEMLLSSGNYLRGRSRESAAQALFSEAGLTLRELPQSFPREEQNLESTNLCCCWNGIPIYNAVLSFDFTAERLYMVSGVMVFNRDTRSETDGMDSVSALVRFLELVEREGIICSRLERITPCYSMLVTMSGECTLTPVWWIVTDTGDIFLNAVSGKTENLY